MKRIIGRALVFVSCAASATFAAPSPNTEPQSPVYLASYFSSPAGSQQVAITSRSGQRLALLEVPAGVTLSVHLSKGEHTMPNDLTGEATFTGDVSIRTRPRSELKTGIGQRDQMMNAPVRLDVQDALVVVLPQKKSSR